MATEYVDRIKILYDFEICLKFDNNILSIMSEKSHYIDFNIIKEFIDLLREKFDYKLRHINFYFNSSDFLDKDLSIINDISLSFTDCAITICSITNK